jgi:protein SCO1/2
MVRISIAIVALLGAMLLACRAEPELPSLGAAPTYSLTDQQGRPFGSADLAGRISLVDFIYTSCTDTCPLLSANMRQVQDELKAAGLFGNKVVLVSFSIDPERDTPPVLAAYAEHFSADPAAWRWLTGQTETIAQLGQDFKLGRPIPLPLDAKSPSVNLAHSNRVVLVDGGGQMRAFYAGEELQVDQVVGDIRRLAR